jgi:hypothetical protein
MQRARRHKKKIIPKELSPLDKHDDRKLAEPLLEEGASTADDKETEQNDTN